MRSCPTHVQSSQGVTFNRRMVGLPEYHYVQCFLGPSQLMLPPCHQCAHPVSLPRVFIAHHTDYWGMVILLPSFTAHWTKSLGLATSLR